MQSASDNPEVKNVKCCENKVFDTMHYEAMPDPGPVSQAKPDVLVRTSDDWLDKFVRDWNERTMEDELVNDDLDIVAADILKKIEGRCEICGAAMFFPFFIREFKSNVSLIATTHQLRGAFAAAFNANSKWVKDDNLIVRLVADQSVADVYVSWIEPRKSLKQTGELSYTWYSSKVARYHLDEEPSFRQLYHVMIRIYMWGLGKRKEKLEEDLKESITTEIINRERRRLGNNTPNPSPLVNDVRQLAIRSQNMSES
ncbi:hypothetical protein F4818DRAFT_189293 [Hypoxylon cercidicola]|nr:hypothetical protein F4818DRAFT_189293 [Hypoxylon cercidicola]